MVHLALSSKFRARSAVPYIAKLGVKLCTSKTILHLQKPYPVILVHCNESLIKISDIYNLYAIHIQNLNHRSVLVHFVDEVCILLHHKVPLDLERRTQLLSLHRELFREHSELLHDVRPLVGLLVGTVKSLLER